MEDAVSIEIPEANTSNENRRHNDRLVSALKNMIESPEPLPSECSIKRIPDHLRKVNEQAYTPMHVSIGPIHHFDKKYQPMEKFKVRYLRSFNSRDYINLENFSSAMWEMEERIRCCYAEATLDMDTGVLLEIILVDAIFILELIVRHSLGGGYRDGMLKEDQMMPIRFDLVLLENQLPFFVLEKLFNLVPELSNLSLIRLTLDFFSFFNDQETTPKIVGIKHFTDLVRIFQLPQSQNLPTRVTASKIVSLMYSATQLHEAGVKFQVNSSKCLFDISFDFKTGVLEMPCLMLFDGSEAFIRNVMAFEQYCSEERVYLIDYCWFLDCLVNTSRDIALLCDSGIICNHLGDNETATSLINKLNNHIALFGMDAKLNRICKDLNNFYKKPWHKWRATLRHEYCSTPWRIASTIAAIILLVFTFIQTVCSIIQLGPTV